MTHPIPIERRVALHDPAFWRPLKGLVSAISERYKMEAETAAALLYEGMSTGDIGHRDATPNGQTWIVSRRGAEIARLAGFSYEEHIDWRAGSMHPPGGRSYLIEVYWPDVDRVACQPRGQTIDGTTEEAEQKQRRTGPTPTVSSGVEAAMRAELEAGKITLSGLMKLKKKELPPRFGGKETTCMAVRKAIFNAPNKLRPNSDLTAPNDK